MVKRRAKETVREECKECKFLSYCKTHDVPCILEGEPAQVIENLAYCPYCDEIVETIKDFTPSCFIVACSKCGRIIDHVDTYGWKT